MKLEKVTQIISKSFKFLCLTQPHLSHHIRRVQTCVKGRPTWSRETAWVTQLQAAQLLPSSDCNLQSNLVFLKLHCSWFQILVPPQSSSFQQAKQESLLAEDIRLLRAQGLLDWQRSRLDLQHSSDEMKQTSQSRLTLISVLIIFKYGLHNMQMVLFQSSVSLWRVVSSSV